MFGARSVTVTFHDRETFEAEVVASMPISTIGRIVPQILKSGHAKQVGIGISVDPLQKLERRLGLDGVIVIQVPERSAAAIAGLKGLTRTRRGLAFGDVIVGVDSVRVTHFDDLYTVLDSHHPDDMVKLMVRRGDAAVTIPIKLSALTAPGLI